MTEQPSPEQADDQDLIDAIEDEMSADPFLYGICRSYDYGRIVGGVIALARLAGYEVIKRVTEQPSPEQTVRLLRAKAAELENFCKMGPGGDLYHIAAAIALVAQLLADHIE